MTNGPLRYNEFGEEVIDESDGLVLSLPDDGDYYNANDEAFITHTKEERIEYLRERHKVYLKTVGPHVHTPKQRERISRGNMRSWTDERKAKVHKQTDETKDKIRNAAKSRKREYLPDGSWRWRTIE